MGITFPNFLAVQAAIPASIESQMPALPKIPSPLMSFSKSLPAGPSLPLPSTTLFAPKLPGLPGMGGQSASIQAALNAQKNTPVYTPRAVISPVAISALSPLTSGVQRGTFVYGS